MHDIRAIRADPMGFAKAMSRRGFPDVVTEIIELDSERRDNTAAAETLQAERNSLAKEIRARRQLGENTTDLEQKASSVRMELAKVFAKVASKEESTLQERLAALPNVLDPPPDVPDGPDESANVEIRQSGELRSFGFTPREHFELGEALGLMDFEAAAKLAGSRFTVLRGPLARLERALGQFMIDLHTEQHGYEETAVPLLVGDKALYGTSQLPKFADDQFQTKDGRWLIPTAEVPLTNLVAGEIIPEARLPIRATALTECFRKEAGSAGRDTRGMLRQHQFRKVELVSITHPSESKGEHEQMTKCAEAVLEKLKLPYRRMLLCSADTGFSAAKTYDLEVWLPGQQAWREISSCSNTHNFQARRMNARYRGADGKPAGFVHTLNGSGVAVGRALIAVMETYQQADGSIEVPDVLRPYMGDIKRIG